MEKMVEYTHFICAFAIIIIFWLYRKYAFYKSEKESLQNMLISLLAKYSNRDNILSNYVYDTRLGVYKHKHEDRFYCHKCFIEETKETPLEPQKDGLHCPVCGSIYKDPDRGKAY